MAFLCACLAARFPNLIRKLRKGLNVNQKKQNLICWLRQFLSSSCALSPEPWGSGGEGLVGRRAGEAGAAGWTLPAGGQLARTCGREKSG